MVQCGRLRFGRYLFDAEEHLLLRDGERVPLSPKVFETLALLLERRGRVVSKTEFMEALWPDTFVEESNLTQNIFVLRKTLGNTESGGPYVETVPKRGYRISTPVEEEPAIADEAVATEAASSAWAMVPGMAALRAAGTEGSSPGAQDGAARGSMPALNPAAGLTAMPAPMPRRRASDHAEPPAQALPPSRGGLYRAVAGLALALAVVFAVSLALFRSHPAALAVVDTARLTDDGVPKNLGPFPSPLVSDGQSLYFTERANNQSTLARVPLAGGLVTTQPAPFPDATIVDYSPVRRELLLGSTWHTQDNRPIMAAGIAAGPSAGTAAGGGPLRLTPLGELTGHDASWSPAADKVAFAQGRFLQAADADGANVHTIVAAPGVVYWPRWSPDGRVLRFSVNFGSNASQIWEVRADGNGLHQVFSARADRDQVCCGSWSADGNLFFYLVTGPASAAIWAAPAHEGPLPLRGLFSPFRPPPEPLKLTAGQADMWRSPLPSANGRAVYAVGSHQRGELMRLDPETREFRPFLSGLSAEGVSFSHNGRWIAYTAYPEGTLWLARPDGSGRRQLTQAPAVARFPRWSPDDRTIAYMAGEAGSRWRLYLVDVASAQGKPLLEDGGNQGVPSWSPDGSKIAFGRLLDYGTERNPNLTVQIFDLVHGSRTTLHGSEGLWTPRWSPDGRYFAAVTENNRVLRLFDCKTAQWSDLANIGVNDVIWSPDGQFLFFDTVFGADPSLYRVRLSDRKLERWADLRGLHRGGFFDPWLGVDAGGSPLLLRDTTVEEVYRLTLDHPN